MPELVVMQNGTRCRGEDRGWAARSRPGFTLMDVMVSMAVIAVLISLLTPSLSKVRETAHQVICRSNVRQFGIGIWQYAEQHGDQVPKCLSLNPLDPKPWDTLYLRFGDEHPGQAGVWDGLGILANPDEEYLPAPKLYYCPSHRGANPYKDYLDQWAGQPGPILGNFQFRGRAPMQATGNTIVSPPATNRLSLMRPGVALVADGMRFQSDFNHVVGANVLHADLSVEWHPDTNRGIFNSLPKEGQTQSSSPYDDAWERLDRD